MTGRWTARGYATCVLGALLMGLGLWWRYPGLAALGVAFLGLAVTALVAMLVPVPVTVHRSTTPEEVARLDTCTGTLSMTNRSARFPLALDATESVGAERMPVLVPTLRPGGSTEVTYPVPTLRHGTLVVGPLRLRRVGLAGLAEGTSLVPGTSEIRVLPRVLPVRGLPPGARRGHMGAEERVAHGGTDLMALREYLPGDDVRRLHWATSARHGSLMVREDADPARAALTVLVDDRAASYPGELDLEEAVDVAASLVGMTVVHRHPCWLRTVSGRVLASAPGTVHSGVDAEAVELRDAVARIAAVDVDRQPDPVPPHALDVVVAVTGAGADLAPFVLAVSRTEVGVVLVVDTDPDRTAGTAGPGLVLRAPRAEELLYAWDLLVVGAG